MGKTIRSTVWKSLIVAFAVLLLMWIGTDHIYSEENGDNTDPKISIYLDDVEMKSFTISELRGLKLEIHSYSMFNAYPTSSIVKNVEGVPIDEILESSGIDVGTIGPKQIIEITAGDGAKERFLKEQLFAQRFYFPNVHNEAGREGKAPLDGSWKDSVEVPPMIAIEGNEGRLYFGQMSPTEQNNSAFLSYVPGKVTSASIRVLSDEGPKWKAIDRTDPADGSVIKQGLMISFDRSVNNDPSNFTNRYCIYYTMDGTEPTMKSSLYNFNNFKFGSPYEKINKPKISKAGNVTIKTKVVGYGMEDSNVSTFTFTGYKVPATPKIKKITAKKKAVTLKWTKVKDAKGYKIYRATNKKGKYKLVKTIGKNGTLTWTNKKLKKKKTYYYKIRAYKNVKGKVIYSNYSAVKYKKTK